ncbi:MAG: DUF2118 domain-containing protein, partial [Proteocatella sp.]
DSDFFDSIYLLDVKEKKYYEIMDEAFNINSGNRFILGEKFDEQYMVMEEYYLEEEEQLEILTSDEVELAFELPGDIKQEQLHVNSIKIIKLSDFIDQVKAGVENIEFQIIDKVNKDGIIRIIGETEEAIYYKKEYYEFILKEKNDFVSRRKMGRPEIYKIDKESRKLSYIRDVDKMSEIRTSDYFIYEIIDNGDEVQIFDLEKGEILYTYKKKFSDFRIKQEVVGFKNSEYLILKVSSLKHEEIYKYEIIDCVTNEVIIIGDDILILDSYIFVV